MLYFSIQKPFYSLVERSKKSSWQNTYRGSYCLL